MITVCFKLVDKFRLVCLSNIEDRIFIIPDLVYVQKYFLLYIVGEVEVSLQGGVIFFGKCLRVLVTKFGKAPLNQEVQSDAT